MLGDRDTNLIIIIEIRIKGTESLIKNSGLNFTLSIIVVEFDGFEDPFSCKRIKCIITRTVITMGRRKCREKNRFKVGCDTEGPPQIHVTRSFPTRGIADRTPVITVAPQNDICPHGSTYPRNAVAITISMITLPDTHTFFWLAGELKYNPRAV
jgi:hypothetical protein